MLLDRISALAHRTILELYGSAPAVLPLDLTADRNFGDLTINAFHLAKDLRLPPPKIAEALALALSGQPPIESAEAVKGFVNLRLDPVALMTETLEPILDDPEVFGRSADLSHQRLMVEYSAPNTNKPQHLGHMRTAFLGHSMARILENAGAEVTQANLYNDRGIQICKSMLAYQRFGDGATPESTGRKGDHFVGDFYVLFEKKLQGEIDGWMAAHPEHFESWKAGRSEDRSGRPRGDQELRAAYRGTFREENFGLTSLGAACQEMLRDWEAGDPAVRELWNRMNAWTYEGFGATYVRLGVAFDRIYKESETYLLGKDKVMEGLERGVFTQREDGAVEIDLTEHKLDKKVVLRSDGTSVYITQDIGTTIMKAEDCNLDGQIWVVGDEQKYHFQVLFKIMEAMGFPWASRLHHLAYGLVHLPDGRMKSREGRVVDADNLMEEVVQLAAAEIRARDPEGNLAETDIASRAEVIGVAALRFMLLKVTAQSHMTFNPEESVKFDGDTGARVLYAYARLRSLLRDGDGQAISNPDWSCLTDPAERHVALALLAFPGQALRAAREHNPSFLASYVIDLVRDLNRFYDRCDVLREVDRKLRTARLALCHATAHVLRRATGLLGMTLLEKM